MTVEAQLSDLRQCAYRLGLAFGHEAERAETHERRMELFRAFDRCFFAVRVTTSLELRLRRAPAALPAEPEREAERTEALERDPPERAGGERYDERDRDVEREPASLPILLRTLEGVVADARALSGPPPAELPTLRELLAQVTSGPIAEPRPAGSALRARLAGSATTQALVLPPPTRPGLHGAPPLRRSTGPPRR